MTARRGVSKLLQAYRQSAEAATSQQLQALTFAAGPRASLHHLAGRPSQESSSFGHTHWHSGREQTSNFGNNSWALPHQARLASTTSPAQPDDETLEGSESFSDAHVHSEPSIDTFSPETTANRIQQDDTAEAADVSTSLDASSIIDAAQIGEADALAAALEGVWPLNAGMQSTLLYLHATSGLPWWGTIAAVTVGVRLLTAPLTLMQIRNTYRMTQARPEMEKITAWYKSEGSNNPQVTAAAQERMAQLWKKYNCNPIKSLVGTLGQASIFMTFFFSLKSLAAAKLPSMVNGGTLWFTDLTTPDAYYGLPILTGGMMLAMVQLNAAEGMQGQPPAMVRNFKIAMSVLAVALVPFSYLLPKSVFIYWMASNACVAIQNSALRLPAVKRYFKIPELKKAEAQASFNAAASVVKTYRHKPAAQRG